MEQKKLDKNDLVKVGSKEFAYLGDSVYETNIRKRLIMDGILNVRELNRQSEKFVTASSQAKIFDALADVFTKSEQAVARRGRNTRIRHRARSVDIATYRKATALECIFGYLMLSGKEERIQDLSDIIFDMVRKG